MAFNPKEQHKEKITSYDPDGGKKLGTVLSQLDIIKAKAMAELKYNPPPPLKLMVAGTPRTKPNPEDYLIEWWELGTDAQDIRVGEMTSSYIKPFIQTFMASGIYSLIYLERKSDGKVIWNRRVRG